MVVPLALVPDLLLPMGMKKDSTGRHSYDAFYESLIQPGDRLLEVGVQYGASAKYFKSLDARYTGIDISLLDVLGGTPGDLYEGDFEKVMAEMFESDLKFDVMIDDGSHDISDQIEFVYMTMGLLADGGTVVIEDLQNPEDDLKVILALFDPDHEISVYDGRPKTGRYDDFLIILIQK